MTEQTRIEWADSTFNPWIGCTKISPACDHCYAEAQMSKRLRFVTWGAGQNRKRTSEVNWRQPLQWNAVPFWQCENCGWRGSDHDVEAGAFCPGCAHGVLVPARRRVFCASLADVFDNEVDPQWRADLFELIANTPNLDWLLLTKRIGNVMSMTRGVSAWPNVWLGATICNQDEADRDIPKLLATPAKVRFVSIEPMLGAIDLEPWLEWPDGGCELPNGKYFGCAGCDEPGGCDSCPRDHSHYQCTEGPTGSDGAPEWVGCDRITLDWVIAGGESGPHARPSHPDWFRSLRDQCAAAGVSFLFKQWGEWCPRGPESLGYPSVDGVPRMRMTDAGGNGQDLAAEGGNDVWMNRAGKKAAGRLLDGIEHNGFPEVGA